MIGYGHCSRNGRADPLRPQDLAAAPLDHRDELVFDPLFGQYVDGWLASDLAVREIGELGEAVVAPDDQGFYLAVWAFALAGDLADGAVVV